MGFPLAPTPQHQHVVLPLVMTLRPWVERCGLGVVLADVDVLFATGQFLRRDLVFVPADRVGHLCPAVGFDGLHPCG